MDTICSKLDTCWKINIILDKDMLDAQYRECINLVCSSCELKEVLV